MRAVADGQAGGQEAGAAVPEQEPQFWGVARGHGGGVGGEALSLLRTGSFT